MSDFTSGFWSWFIGVTTVISIIALIVFALKLSGSKKSSGKESESVGHIWDEDLHELNNPLPRWWLNLFLITLFWGGIYLFLYPGLGSYAGYRGWTQIKQYENELEKANEQYGPLYEKFHQEDIATLAVNDEALTIGKRLFSTYCTTCHGSDAGGARGFPSLRDSEWLYGGKPENIKASILNGRNGAMPAWGASLSEEDIFNVAEYIRIFSGLSADERVAAQGQQIFTTYCVVCHGDDGKGKQDLGAPDLTNDIWLYGGSQKRIIESITHGRNGVMPPHQNFLGDAKAHLLAAYVYSLSHRE